MEKADQTNETIKTQTVQTNQTPQTTNLTRKIILTALFIGLAVAVRSFSTMIYFLGAPGMRISLSPVFTRMPAILFGPLYGGIAAGIADILGYLVKMEGAFIPLLTITAILGGVITGLLWSLFKNADIFKLQRGLRILFIVIGAIGLFNYLNEQFLPNWEVARFIEKAGKYKDFLTLGLIAVSIIGIILLVLDYAVKKKFPQAAINKYYLKVLLPFGLSGLIVTILNTYILRIYIPQLAKIAFVLLLIPRVLEEILMMVIQSYISSFLLVIYDRYVKNISK